MEFFNRTQNFSKLFTAASATYHIEINMKIPPFMFPWFRTSAYKISLPSNCLHLYTTFFARMQGTTINNAETKLCHLFYSQKILRKNSSQQQRQKWDNSTYCPQTLKRNPSPNSNSLPQIPSQKFFFANNNRNEVEIVLKL